MTRRAFVVAALLASAAGSLRAATFDAKGLAYLPLRYSAGDEVLVQASILPEDGETLAPLELAPGSGLPPQDGEADPELRGLSLVKGAEGWILSLRFVPWSPGPGRLPALRLEGMSLPALPYAALSLLGPEDREPSPPRPQRDLPGAALFLYGLAGFLLALGLAAAGTILYLVPAARALVARRKAAYAYARLARSLDYLSAGAGTSDPEAVFAALSRALRLYLEARVLPAAPALSPPELAGLPAAAFPAPATKDRTAGLLAAADKARFGGDPSRPSKRADLEAAIEEARSIAAANEEALRARA